MSNFHTLSLIVQSNLTFIKHKNQHSFQSRDLKDRETQEAQMWVCPSQMIIRFKSMNSSVNSFPEWQKLLDIDESD